MMDALEEMMEAVTGGSGRPDAPVDRLRSIFGFELWDGPPDWRGRPVRPQLESMLQAAYHFVSDVKESKRPRWLTLLGTNGAGKTFLARKIWKWYRNESGLFRASVAGGEIVYPGSFQSWPEMADLLQGNRGYDELEGLMSEKLVVLDEIGADRDKSGHVRDCLARLCSMRAGKWTILTSNLSLGDIQRELDSRIASRILRDGSALVEVEVPDFSLRFRAVKKEDRRA